MAKYLKIQSIILCICMLISALSGLSVIAADPLELVTWDADLDFITLDFNQAVNTGNADISLTKDGQAVEFTFAKKDFAAVTQANLSDNYTYLVTPTGGLTEDAEYELTLASVENADGSSALTNITKKFLVDVIGTYDNFEIAKSYRYPNDSMEFDDTNKKVGIAEFTAFTGNNAGNWHQIGALVGDDITAGNIIPYYGKTGTTLNGSFNIGSGNWKEGEYTIKFTYKGSAGMKQDYIAFGLWRGGDPRCDSSTAAFDGTVVQFQRREHSNSAASSYADDNASYRVLLYDRNTTTNAGITAKSMVYADMICGLNTLTGMELKMSIRDGYARVFTDDKKVMDSAIYENVGFPYIGVNPRLKDDGYTSASYEISGIVVTQVREICATELDKTENVEVRDTLNVTFENAIDPATKDDIKIIPEGGEAINSDNYTVSLSGDNKVATITFVNRLEYETNYTIDLGDVKVAGKPKMLITNLGFRTKDLPPQSPELIASWDADFGGVTICFSEPISEYDATLSKNGVEIEATAGAIAGPEVISIAPVSGIIEEGAVYEVKLENISNADDSKALLIWKKTFVLGTSEGEPYCFQKVNAQIDPTEGLDITDTVEITFDTEIDEATIGEIKLAEQGGEYVDEANYTVSLSADKLTATIEFADLTYETAHDVEFDGVKVYEEDRLAAIDTLSFETKIEPVEIEEVLVDWNADLDFITLDFNAEITSLSATLTQGNSTIPVTFSSAASSSMDAGNSTRYTYKIVPTGGIQKDIGYTLTIGNVVCATEVKADAEWTLNFKVEVIDEGFVDPKTAAGNDTYVYNGNGTVTQHEDGKGIKVQYEGVNKARTMIAHGVGSDSDASKSIGTVTAQPNSVYTQKDYTIKATFKNISGTSSARIGIAHTFAVNGSYTYNHTWFRGIGIQLTIGSASLNAYSKPVPTNLGDTDGDGATNYDYNATTVSDSSYSALNGTTGVELKLAMKGDRANFFLNGGKMLDIINHGDRGAAALIFEPTASTTSNAYGEIVDIVMTRAYEICPAEIDVDTDVELTGEVTVTLDEDVDPAMLSKVKLLDSEGNEAENYTVTAGSSNEIVVSFSDLAYKSVYTINLEEVTLESGKELADIPFMTIYPATEIESFGVVGGGAIEGTVTISAVIKNNTDPNPCAFTATVAIYNSRGQMVAVEGAAYTLATGQDCTVSVTDFVCDSEETYTAKCFVWDSLEDMTEKEFALAPETAIGE